jgi:hypothetical protein
MGLENVRSGTIARNIGRTGFGLLGCSVLIFAIIAASVATLDYAAVRRNQIGNGWRYASHAELATALRDCGVQERNIIRAGFIFKFGWAWNSFQEERAMRSKCLDAALTKIGATAAIYDAMG